MKSSRSHFPRIQPIAYEGTRSANPLAFRHYNPDEVIDGRTMSEHLRFSIAYWHAFRGTGSDPFGPGTINRPWEKGSDPVSIAKVRMGDVVKELIPFYAVAIALLLGFAYLPWLTIR